MRTNDKASYKLFEAIRDDHVVPLLHANGFRLVRNGVYEQVRDDAVNRVKIEGRTDRRADVCYVQVYLSISYREAAELLAAYLGSKKAGLAHASTTDVQLHLICPPTACWTEGLDDPRHWASLLPEKDSAVLGPILANLIREYAFPYFAARSSIDYAINPPSSRPDGESYNTRIRAVCMWLRGRRTNALDLLRTKEAELEKCCQEGSAQCVRLLAEAKSVREFLERQS